MINHGLISQILGAAFECSQGMTIHVGAIAPPMAQSSVFLASNERQRVLLVAPYRFRERDARVAAALLHGAAVLLGLRYELHDGVKQPRQRGLARRTL